MTLPSLFADRDDTVRLVLVNIGRDHFRVEQEHVLSQRTFAWERMGRVNPLEFGTTWRHQARARIRQAWDLTDPAQVY